MVLTESQVKEILNKIDHAVINPTTIHPLDEERVESLFKNMLKHDVKYEVSDIQTIVDHLDPKYREYSRERIFHIAEVHLRKLQRTRKSLF